MIYRQATNDSPEVKFNIESKILIIKGNSYPENCSGLYNPIKQFIENYNIEEMSSLELHCHFNLLNSTSSVHIAQLIMLLADKRSKGLNCKVIWTYDEHDEEMLDLGEKLASISKLDIEFKVELDD
ncbi:MAG: DUF1987 domain-containing protein [Vicingaceae bacterium]|nr:DUF1987 domain-containing protein [Vicingaceae bacterium]